MIRYDKIGFSVWRFEFCACFDMDRCSGPVWSVLANRFEVTHCNGNSTLLTHHWNFKINRFAGKNQSDFIPPKFHPGQAVTVVIGSTVLETPIATQMQST